ncbi:MAG: hypothetical protein J6O73_05310 [Lachnospiraceae bacterium]|nr:hypothetical protein [Lachnospiraceae bacterium]
MPDKKLKKNFIHALKVTLTAIVTILIAEGMHLQFSVSAGIVAILSVAFTKRETIKTARDRFAAFTAALVIAALCFYMIGFDLYGFFVYLLLFILLCQFMGWNSAMAMDSVLISHFLTFQNMEPASLSNEVMLFLIGVGGGIIANLFLHKDAYYMKQMRQETDELMKHALHRMSLRIMDPDLEGYDGSCFDTLNRTIDEAYALARLNYLNQVSKEDTKDMEYISMREKQADTLYEMYKHIRQINTVPVTAEILSAFFEKVSEQYSMENTVEDLLKDFEKLNAEMQERPLPAERHEFEDRARLFAIMRGMEEFLKIKKEYVVSSGKA